MQLSAIELEHHLMFGSCPSVVVVVDDGELDKELDMAPGTEEDMVGYMEAAVAGEARTYSDEVDVGVVVDLDT